MGLAKGYEYVKTVGGKIYVRGSCFADYHANGFYANDARELAGMIVKEADKLNGSPSGTVTLTLDRGEAEAVSAVLNRIGGDPKTSPRGKVQGVAAKLSSAGVKPLDCKFETIGGGLWFKNYDGTSTDAGTKMLAELLFGWADQ